MESDAIRSFALDLVMREDRDDLYVRVRAGDKRSRAEVAVSDLEVGDDGEELYARLAGELEALEADPSRFAWVECLKRGGRSPIRVVVVELRDEEDQEQATGALVRRGESPAAAHLAVELVRASKGYQGIAVQLLRENRELMGEVARLSTTLAELVATAEAGGDLERTRLALEGLERMQPLLMQVTGFVAQELARGKGRPAGGPPPGSESPEEEADRLVAELTAVATRIAALAGEAPQVFTQARALAVVAAFGLVQKAAKDAQERGQAT